MRRAPDRLRLVADRDEPLSLLLQRQGGIAGELARAAVERGSVFLRGQRERRPDAPVRKGDRVDATLRAPPSVELTRDCILHLDELVLAVDKPAGVAAQDDLAGAASLPALCSQLLARLGEKQTQALLVHRLDRGTTGVAVLARTRRAQAALLEEFREHRPLKEYRALVKGAPARPSGEVTTPLEARPARTAYEVIERFRAAAHVRALPLTGRTHQVRLHLRELGCPLLGDRTYDGPAFLTRPDGARIDFARPMLHALSLSLRHPSGADLRLLSPTPADFSAALRFLRG